MKGSFAGGDVAPSSAAYGAPAPHVAALPDDPAAQPPAPLLRFHTLHVEDGSFDFDASASGVHKLSNLSVSDMAGTSAAVDAPPPQQRNQSKQPRRRLSSHTRQDGDPDAIDDSFFYRVALDDDDVDATFLLPGYLTAETLVSHWCPDRQSVGHAILHQLLLPKTAWYYIAIVGFALCVLAGGCTFAGQALYSGDVDSVLYKNGRLAFFALFPLAIAHVLCDFANMDRRLMKVACMHTEGIFLNLQFLGFTIGSVMSFSEDTALVMFFVLIMLSIQILLMLDALPVRVRRSRLFGACIIASVPVCALLAIGFSLKQSERFNRHIDVCSLHISSNQLATSTATTLTLFVAKQVFKWLFRPSETSSLSAPYCFFKVASAELTKDEQFDATVQDEFLFLNVFGSKQQLHSRS